MEKLGHFEDERTLLRIAFYQGEIPYSYCPIDFRGGLTGLRKVGK